MEEDNQPVYIEYPEEVLELRVNDIADRVAKIEEEFFASFTVAELQAELFQSQHFDEDILDLKKL